MTEQELFQRLKHELALTIQEGGLEKDRVELSCRGLSAREALGDTTRKDYPILLGREVMVQAELRGSIGQAFTDAPGDFSGTPADILNLDTEAEPRNRAFVVAALNAVLRHLGRIDHSVHCRGDEPEQCAVKYGEYLKQRFGARSRIALVGYQPALTAALGRDFTLRVLDLNPEVVGTERSGITVEHGVRDYEAVVKEWADVVLCTGSVLCNASFINFVNLGKPTVFFGISGAGAAAVFGLERYCPMSA